MADEPDNLVLKLLREIRGKQDEHSEKLKEHDTRFDDLDKTLETFKFQLTHTFGLAGMANLQAQHTDAKLSDVADRQKKFEADFKKLEEMLSKD